MKYLILSLILMSCTTSQSHNQEGTEYKSKPKDVVIDSVELEELNTCAVSQNTSTIMSFVTSKKEARNIYGKLPMKNEYVCTFHYFAKNKTYYFQYETCRKVSQINKPNYQYYLGSISKQDMNEGKSSYIDFTANIVSLNREEIISFINEAKMKKYGYTIESLERKMNIKLSRFYQISLASCKI